MSILLAALAVLLLIDWQQTLRIARNPDRWLELNPLLGRHPSKARVHLHFAAFAGLMVLAWFVVPKPLLAALYGCVAGCEAICVANNWRIGLH